MITPGVPSSHVDPLVTVLNHRLGGAFASPRPGSILRRGAAELQIDGKESPVSQLAGAERSGSGPSTASDVCLRTAGNLAALRMSIGRLASQQTSMSFVSVTSSTSVATMAAWVANCLA